VKAFGLVLVVALVGCGVDSNNDNGPKSVLDECPEAMLPTGACGGAPVVNVVREGCVVLAYQCGTQVQGTTPINQGSCPVPQAPTCASGTVSPVMVDGCVTYQCQQ
jgi:hypothetical protein